MLNDTSVASAGSYIRTCRRIRNSKKIATIRDFHQNICVNPTKRLLFRIELFLRRCSPTKVSIPKVRFTDRQVYGSSLNRTVFIPKGHFSDLFLCFVLFCFVLFFIPIRIIIPKGHHTEMFYPEGSLFRRSLIRKFILKFFGNLSE